MITLFLNCCNSQLDPSEDHDKIDFDAVYQVGDIVNRGQEFRWKIVRIDEYVSNDGLDLNIAYLQLADRDFIPESDWDTEVNPDNRKEGIELEIQTINGNPSNRFSLSWRCYGEEPFEPEIGSIFGTLTPIPNEPAMCREVAPFYRVNGIQRFSPVGDTIFKAVVLTTSDRVDPGSVDRAYRSYLICRETDIYGWDVDFGTQEFVVFRDLANLEENLYVNPVDEFEGDQYLIQDENKEMVATCDRWVPYRHEVFTPSGDCSFDGIVVLFHKPVDEAIKYVQP